MGLEKNTWLCWLLSLNIYNHKSQVAPQPPYYIHSGKYPFPLSKMIINTTPFSLNIKYLFLLIILRCYFPFSFHWEKTRFPITKFANLSSSLPLSFGLILAVIYFALLHLYTGAQILLLSPKLLLQWSALYHRFSSLVTESFPKAYKHAVTISIFALDALITVLLELLPHFSFWKNIPKVSHCFSVSTHLYSILSLTDSSQVLPQHFPKTILI